MSLFNTTTTDDYDLWEKIIYHINGTCDSLEQALATFEAEHLQDYMPFLDYLDNEIFRCDCCSWWCPVSESSEISPSDCRDCVPDEDE